MRTKVTEKHGIVVVCGQLLHSTHSTGVNGEMKGIYDLVTFNNSWIDPTGRSCAKRIRWKVYARQDLASLANPNNPLREFFDGYLVIEGVLIPGQERTQDLLWRERNGRARKTIPLQAKFVTDPASWELDELKT